MYSILIISDTDYVNNLIDQYIPLEKQQVITKYRSNEIVKIQRRDYDLVLLDFDKEMIEQSKFKLIFDIKYRSNAPILVIMERCSTKDKLAALNFGAEDYIEHPVTREEFIEKMDNLIRLKRVLKKIEINEQT